MAVWGSVERWLEAGALFKMELPGVPERLCGAQQDERVKDDLVVSWPGQWKTGVAISCDGEDTGGTIRVHSCTSYLRCLLDVQVCGDAV